MKPRIPFIYRIPLIYIILGALWILFSDKLVLKLWNDPYQQNIISIYKGWLFVSVTGILLFLLIKREIDKRNKLYNQLLEANKKAQEADRLKSAFLSNLSHYIRTPMNSILGFVDLLKSRKLDEEKQIQFIKIIDGRSHLLLNTIKNIVEISKLQEGQLSVNYSSFSLNKLIRELAISFKHDSSKNEKDLFFNHICSLSDEDCFIISDYNIIYNILTNLISNAINFTAKGGIELGYNAKGDEITFFVSDTGIGISKEKSDKLFNSYLDGDSINFDQNEGSGIGLYLASQLATLLNGKLWLEYTGVTGSKFCLKVPVHKG